MSDELVRIYELLGELYNDIRRILTWFEKYKYFEEESNYWGE